MIRPNDFTAVNRQDDLLKRLKKCVGSLQTTSKDHKTNPSIKQPEVFISKPLLLDEPRKTINYQPRSEYRSSLGARQNLTDKKYYIREQDSKKSNDKENLEIVTKPQNYLERNFHSDIKPYRKQSLPLAQNTSISNTKIELFGKQVSDSTKKRIAERESLINPGQQKKTLNKLPQKTISKHFNQDEFLQRLSLRKISYLDHLDYRKNVNQQNTRNQEKIILQSERPINISNDIKPLQIFQKSHLDKYRTYSKTAMENLVKDNDLRKAQKMQKLKKITAMNDEINKKIRRIVDTFENYLTHRQI